MIGVDNLWGKPVKVGFNYRTVCGELWTGMWKS